MYIVRGKFHEVKGDVSVSIKYERGVYQKTYDSPPVLGAMIRIEVNPREHKDFDVVEIVEQTENRVVFMDQNYFKHEWIKVA